jgi:hypothetical protein
MTCLHAVATCTAIGPVTCSSPSPPLRESPNTDAASDPGKKCRGSRPTALHPRWTAATVHPRAPTSPSTSASATPRAPPAPSPSDSVSPGTRRSGRDGSTGPGQAFARPPRSATSTPTTPSLTPRRGWRRPAGASARALAWRAAHPHRARLPGREVPEEPHQATDQLW